MWDRCLGTAQKTYALICIVCRIPPAGDHTAQEVESAETARSISAFLRSQPEQARNIFIRRYWYCDATADIAKRYGIGESKVRVTLHRMRTKLKAYLEKEGVCL